MTLALESWGGKEKEFGYVYLLHENLNDLV
jgi:hypothetical protein